MQLSLGVQAIGVIGEGRTPGYGAWLAVGLVSISSLAGAWLARRNSTRVVAWLAIASATMLVIAMTDLLPDAWREAADTGVPIWVIGIATAAGFLVVTYFIRKGCGCAADSARASDGRHAPGRHRRLPEAVDTALYGGMGTAAALTTHRAIEGVTMAFTASVVVIVALMVHAGHGPQPVKRRAQPAGLLGRDASPPPLVTPPPMPVALPEGEMCVCDLAVVVRASESAAAHPEHDPAAGERP